MQVKLATGSCHPVIVHIKAISKVLITSGELIWRVGGPSHPCAVHVCALWYLKLGLAFWSCALLVGPVDVAWVEVGTSSLSVWPLPFSHAPSIGLAEAFQSVNEVADPGGMVWLEERLSVCKRLLIVWRWICSTHIGSGLCGCGGMSSTSLCAFWCWPGCAVLLALFVGFQWLVKISWRMGLLEEQNGTVVGVFWPLPPSGP